MISCVRGLIPDNMSAMCFSSRRLLAPFLLVSSACSLLRAAPHPEITPLPLGTTAIQTGVHDRSFRLPHDAQGVVNQPMILLASQPIREFTGVDAPAAGAQTPPKRQVEATIKLTVGDRALPPWVLQPELTAYVISFETIRSNPQFEKGQLGLKVELISSASAVGVAASGMPDPRLLGEVGDGPLNELVSKSADPEIKSYFAALQQDLQGKATEAREAYAKLSAGKNASVGRFARRGLRGLSYDNRPRKLTGNFNEHFRWALFLEMCGLTSHAYNEYNECRVIYPDIGRLHYRTAECADRLVGMSARVLPEMLDAATNANAPECTDWNALVVILGERGIARLGGSELADIKNRFLEMQGMVWAASRGRLRIIPTFVTVWDVNEWAHHFRGDGVLGPSDEIVRERGWFDSVFSIVPKPANESVKVATVGADEGPNGAAMSMLPHDASWSDYLDAFLDQYSHAADVCEAGPGIPSRESEPFFGRKPVPSHSFAMRASIADGMSDSLFRRVKIADDSIPGTYIQMWNLEGPFAIKEKPPADGRPSHHVLDPLPESSRRVRVTSESPFIDLTRVYPDAGWAMARATTYVFSPVNQEVRMWIGQNDGVAAWVNGVRVHEGRYYSAGQFEDRNLVDTVASYAKLREGWNEIRLVIESWPAPLDRGWGFSIRLCDVRNKELQGLAYAFAPPEALVTASPDPRRGPHYKWDDARGDVREHLPHLSMADLSEITGVKDLSVHGETHAGKGYVALISVSRSESNTYRQIKNWQMDRDYDVKLNNVMDCAREAALAFCYEKNGQKRALLILKTEWAENLLTLLREPAEAEKVFDGKPPTERILGYLEIGPTAAIVVDCMLGDERNWPVDEEDLMNPIPPKYLPNRGIKTPVVPTH